MSFRKKIRMIFFMLLLTPIGSQAAVIPLAASLDGAQEVPANASPGTGVGTMTYDDVANLLSWNITFSGLTAGTTVAHFHGPAAPGDTASPVITIPLDASLGMTSGNLVGMATLADETQESQLLSELWYINIHTSSFPNGEIRGQVLSAVPIPSAVWLFISGVSGFMALARRRKN